MATILATILVPIMPPMHGLNGLAHILGHAGLAGDQVHHKAGLAGEPVPHPVVQASEGASEPGGLHDLWAAVARSPHSGVGMLETPRREQVITVWEWKVSEPTSNKMLL